MGTGKAALVIGFILVFGMSSGEPRAQGSRIDVESHILTLGIGLADLKGRVAVLEEAKAKQQREIEQLHEDVQEARNLAELAGMGGP